MNALLPSMALGAGVVGLLAAGLPARAPRALIRAVSLAALAVAAALAALSPLGELWPMARLDALARAWQVLVCVAALPLSLVVDAEDEVSSALLVGSVLGMCLLAVADSLLLLFIGLEFMSLPAYLLVARAAESGRGHAALEAAIKYFFAGSVAAALFLFGLALHYGASGTLAIAPAEGPLAAAGAALMLAAALFKVGAVPLHFWLPDAYEGAPPELAGFLSTAVKAAGMLLLLRVASLAPELSADWLPWLGALGALVGAAGALRQETLQRLLAYSSISHAGFMVFGVGAWAARGGRPEQAVAVLGYLGAYLFMSNGAFLCLKAGGLVTRADLRGLSARRPWLAAAWAALLLALAGVPPSAGFLAKLAVFWDALRAGLLFPALGLAAAALISMAYYLALVRDAFFERGEGQPSPPCHGPSFALALACALPAAALGLAPWLLGALERGLR